jgi:hypothetical protein
MTRWLLSVGIVAVLVCACGAGAAQAMIRLSGPVYYDLPLQPEVMAVADVNRDGLSDVVVGTRYGWGGRPPETRLLLRRRAGRFSAARSLHVAPRGGFIAGGVAFGDLNGDGHRDVVRVLVDLDRRNGSDPSTLVVMFGDGRGAFPTTEVRRARCCGWDVIAADFNRDHHDDLAVRGVGVFPGNGSGLFPTVQPGQLGDEPIDSSESFVAADLNRDRRLDLVVLNSDEDPEPAHIQLGRGNGRFGAPEVLAVGDVGSVAVGRFNRGRRPDLAAITPEGLRVLLGTRSGKPRAVGPTYLADAEPLHEVEVADIDLDGKSDLVVTGYADSRHSGGNVRILRGTGRGSFRRPVEVAHCCFGSRLEIGYFNRDRRPDVAVTSSIRNSDATSVERLSILINETPRSIAMR